MCTPNAWKSYDSEQSKSRKRPCPSGSPSVTKFFKAEKADRGEMITHAISKYLIKSMRPISEVENEGFVDMWKEVEPEYRLPTRKTMRIKVQEQCDNVQLKLREIVGQSEVCAAQCDIWTSRRMHGYFGLCLTLIRNGALETRLVACRRFLGAHTADNISTMFSSLVQEFGVMNKMKGIVTDNASNMVKAFKADEGEGSDQLSLIAIPSEGDDDLMRINIDWSEVEDEFPTPIPTRYGCMAHMLQLVVKDGLNEATARIKTLLQKCASLVSTIHKSCKATELLEEHNIAHIPTPNATRWNSTYSMLTGLVKAEDVEEGILKKVTEVTSSTVLLSPKDLDTLKELRLVLAHFSRATKLMETESQPTSGLVIPTVVGLEKALVQVDTQHTTSVRTGLQCSLKSRFGHLMSDEHFLISAALDPRCKLKWVEKSDQERQIHAIIQAKCEAVETTMPKLPASATSSDTDASQSAGSSDIACDLLGYMKTSTLTNQQSSEFNDYLQSTSDISDCIGFWQTHRETYPKLYQLHIHHHVIPATSAAIERAFSLAGLICSERRNRLDNSVFESLLLAKANKDLL